MRHRTSLRRPGCWGWAFAGLALHTAAGAGVLLSAVQAAIQGVPGWVGIAAAPAVALLLGVGAGRRAPRRGLVAALVMTLLHAALLAAGVTLWDAWAPTLVGAAAPGGTEALGPLALLGLVTVPLILAPFRDLLVPRPARRPRAPARAWPPSPPRPARPREPLAPADAPPVTDLTAPRAAAGSGAPLDGAGRRDDALLEAEARASATPGSGEPAEPPTVSEDERPRAGAGAATDRPLGPEPVEDVLRVPFERVADQLPPGAFKLPLERLAVNLLEPGFLLVPQRLVVGQLAEGVVEVPWEAVADQVPGAALAWPRAEVGRRLPGGRLRLPLDELVRQLPPELFAVPAGRVDLDGLDDFPPPFQPHVPPPAPEPTEPEGRAGTPDVPAPAGAPVADVAGPERDGPRDVVDAVPGGPRLADLLAEAADTRPAPDHTAAVGEAPAARDVPAPSRARALEAGPRARGTTPAPAVPGGAPAWLPAPPLPGGLALAVEHVAHDGWHVTVAAAGALPARTVAAMTVRALPFLGDDRLPTSAQQLTVRGARTTIVVTPYDRDRALAVAVESTGSLALLERWALRAAGAGVSAASPGHGLAALEPGPGGVRDGLVGVLRVFGPLSATVLEAVDGAGAVHAFLPRGVAPLPLGALARELVAALAALTPVAIVLRLGAGRLVVRALAPGRPGAPLLLVGGERVTRPGRAWLALERAAARLGAR